MATITVRGLSEQLKARLRVRAAERGRSMEAEVREILSQALEEDSSRKGLGSEIHEIFAAVGGAELESPGRDERPRAAEFPD